MPVPKHLVEKYNVPAPRYTSYPTVPYWDDKSFDPAAWIHTLKTTFNQSNAEEGISIYVHLPFCENLCTYCGCNTRITKNHAVEEPYIQAVLREWLLYLETFTEKPVIRELHFGGGTPTFFSPARLTRLVEGLLEHAVIHPKAAFSFEAHPANTTHEHLLALYNAGFRRLSLGIQDFDPRVQFIINRVQSFEQVEQVTNQAREIGYQSVNFDLIYGLPLQTRVGLIETLQKVSLLRPDRIAFYSYAHVPWVKPGQRRYSEKDIPDAELKRKLYSIGRELFVQLGYKEIGMDHFALQSDSLYMAKESGTLHRNFMGYTDQHTKLLIGLGVSAIGDAWGAYAQNAKNVEEYTAMVNSGAFPVTKAHQLTEEDLVLRRHIQNIMCTGKTCWNHHTHNSEALFNAIERLQPMAEDDLVELSSWGLTVTPTGRRFLRNICMAFDARLWTNTPATQLFSMNG